MSVKRGMALVAAGLVMTPVAFGFGIVMLVAAVEDEDEPGNIPVPVAGSLRIGKGGVPAQYAQLIMDAAAACDQGLPPSILAAQIKQESGFNPTAQSKDANGNPIASGISQFIPGTWATEGIDGNKDGNKDVWDPEDAIPSQGSMMCKLLKTAKKHPGYRGSPVELALAGYNAGWGRVDEYRGVPPARFAQGQTYNYVKIIMATSASLAAPADDAASGDWAAPVGGPASTPYRQPGSSWSSGYHTGIDFVVPVGTSVRAVGPGTVVTAGPGGAYGNQVVIRHKDGKYSQYAHLSSVAVRAGQNLQGPTRIGLSGNTGNSTGPHLHFEIRNSPAYGSDISPIPYLRRQGVRI
ncbi:peptidoglycan DD-metalloendopeptidase family protein [Streptomyces sp. 21So2-11]|uniref:peptidoglycan DD-metalloendopeptidase family protein n=1 Tax=Streptomyces sp. 21So2-11 TaxID=3144408 RepID=UPI00321BD33F